MAEDFDVRAHFSTAALWPAFAAGFVIIDARDAPSLRHAVCSRIWKNRKSAERQLAESRRFTADAEFLHVVPVDGPNGIFGIDYIDGAGVVVNSLGTIRMMR